jgi:hypothetical protein
MTYRNWREIALLACLATVAIGSTYWKIADTCPAQWNAAGDQIMQVAGYAVAGMFGWAVGEYAVGFAIWVYERTSERWARST